MTSEVVLPELGENIEVADVSAVLVAVGDRIRQDQPVIEVETEKASLEVPASADGKVKELNVSVGDKIKVGSVILVLELGGAGAAETPAADPGAVDQKRDTQPRSGDAVSTSSDAGADDSSAPGEARPAEGGERREASVIEFRAGAPAPGAPPKIGRTVPAAPSVRALARELGIEINEVPGSGRAGRITRDDVKAWAKRLIRSSGAAAPAAGRAPSPALPDFSRWGEVRREPLPRIRRIVAENMTRAWTTVPHVTQFDRADVTRFEEMRRGLNRRPEIGDAKLTVTAFVLKVVGEALARFPLLNASVDAQAGEVVYKSYVNVGVAVDTDRGLLVPVVRDVRAKSLMQVAADVAALAARARERKLEPDAMAGASFTVSNLGGLGTTYFSPIVNWPEVAILGVGRATTEALWIDGRFEPRGMLPLSISYDHRLIDGADAARFLRWVAEALEQPLLLLLGDDGQPER